MKSFSKAWNVPLAVVLALVLCGASAAFLAGCSQGASQEQGAAEQLQGQGVSFEASDVSVALEALPAAFAGYDAAIVDASFDETAKTVYLTFNVPTEDVVAAIDIAEQACKIVSDQAYQAAAARLEQDGRSLELSQDEAAQRCDGLGALYEEYSLSLLLDNDAGTLDVVGVRDAGVQGFMNWQ